jgi:hypothetical protein
MILEADFAAGMAPGAIGDIACAGRPDTVASANKAAAATPKRRTRPPFGSFVPIIVITPVNAGNGERTAMELVDRRDRSKHERSDSDLNAA